MEVTARHPSGSYHLAYRNPEIIDRVVDYYLLVAEGSFPSNDDNSLSGEGQAESILNLAAVAETTYDPRLHEAVLFNVGFLTGDFRYHYLATVNPEPHPRGSTRIKNAVTKPLGQTKAGAAIPNIFIIAMRPPEHLCS